MRGTAIALPLRPRRSLIAQAITATAAIALALTACTAARNAAPISGSASPVNGGTLTVAMALDALPSAIFATVDRNYPWIDNVFEPLVRLDPKTRKVEPVLATQVTVAADGKSAVIDLRKGVTFQTGTPLTADAVKFTFQKSIAPQVGDNLAFVAKQFTAITVVNPNRLSITFAKPLGDSFYDYLNQTEIVDPSTYSGLKDGSKVVGTGPFSFGSWRPGAGFTLTRYKQYWNAKSVHLDKIDYVVTTDPTAEIDALKGGRAQIAYGMTASDAQAFSGNKQYRPIAGGGSIYPLGLNVMAAPFNNKTVRQAVGYAIDAQRINQQVFAGTGTVTDLPWGVSDPGNPKALQTHYSYDPAKAKAMIGQAGAAGAKVQITYNRSNAAVNAEYQIVANNLAAVGLVPVADGRDQPTYQAAQTNATIPQSFLTLHGQVGLSATTILQALPTLRPGNPSHEATSIYSTLTAAVVNAASTSTRASALEKLSNYMLDQAFLLTMVQAPDAIVAATSVNGVAVSQRGMVLFNSAYVNH